MKRHQTAAVITIAALLAVAGFVVVAPTAAADSGDIDGPTVTTESTDGDVQNTTCEGAPRMSQTSIISPEDRITSEQPGVVEANFRVDPSAPEECEVVVDLEFSFAESGFQFGGGAEWDQSTTNLVATTYEGINPREVRDIRAELHTNGAQAGDEVTVIADYEIWYEGDRENSVQQSGIRHTIDVEQPNEPDDPIDEEPSDGDDNDTSSDEAEANDTGGSEDEPGGDTPGGLLGFIEDHLGLLAVFALAAIAVVGLIVRKPEIFLNFNG